MLVLYTMRYRKANHGSMPVGILVLGVYLGLHLFMSGGMLIYHTQLSMLNLTTNEQFNVHKYNYFWITDPMSGGRRFRNPWSKGRWGNFRERLFFPSPACYMLPEEREGLLQQRNSSE